MRSSARAVLTVLAAVVVAGGIVRLALDDERQPASMHEAEQQAPKRMARRPR